MIKDETQHLTYTSASTKRSGHVYTHWSVFLSGICTSVQENLLAFFLFSVYFWHEYFVLRPKKLWSISVERYLLPWPLSQVVWGKTFVVGDERNLFQNISSVYASDRTLVALRSGMKKKKKPWGAVCVCVCLTGASRFLGAVHDD